MKTKKRTIKIDIGTLPDRGWVYSPDFHVDVILKCMKYVKWEDISSNKLSKNFTIFDKQLNYKAHKI